MAVLVAGGAGFIGSHTSVELLERGDDIVIADNFSNSKPEVLNRIKKITGKELTFCLADLCNYEEVDGIFAKYSIDSVIHFAGYKAVGESVAKPLMYYENNLISTFNILKAMKKYGCNKLVFSSSATVYGIPKTVPINEDFPLSAINPYGQTKLMIENILRDCCNADGELSVVLLRYFNPIGAHESGLIGEDPKGIPNNLMPYIMKVASGALPHLNVFGDDYPTKDGSGVRDYIHVVDLAKGHLCALDYMKNNKGVLAVNLGTGNGYSVFEMVKAYEKASGVKIPLVVTQRRAGDAAECYADPAKAKEVLGWSAQYGIDRMCDDAVRWQTNNPNGYDC